MDLPEGAVVKKRAHKDGRGATFEYECGCALTIRGGTSRRKFCDEHGALFPAPTEALEDATP